MKTAKTLVCLCALVALACTAGCKLQHTTTLQGTIFNAITGERILGDVQMILHQGAVNRGPDVYHTGQKGFGGRDNSTAYLAGDYVFLNIPSLDNATPNSIDPHGNEYRLTVMKEGYQKFEGIINVDMLANKDTVIKNIYLFPTSYMIPCYNYATTYYGKPVPGVTVVASPYATLSPGIIATDKWLSIGLGEIASDPSVPFPFSVLDEAVSVFALFNNNYFFPAPGYLQNIIKTTDANGTVSFCKEELTAGGAYLIYTLPFEFEAVDLDFQIGGILIAGYGPVDNEIELNESQNAKNPYGLYITSASNAIAGQVEASGKLVITFNRPVTVTGDFGLITTDGVLNANPVTEELSADGLTLTLTPVFDTAPTAANTIVTYSNGTAFVSPTTAPAAELLIFGSCTVGDADDSCIGTTVQMIK